MKRKGSVFIGTSGFHYDHWKGRFYPADLKKTQWLDFYTKHFTTLELNNSFYRLPYAESFDKWRKAVPDGFIFSVKGSRYITHQKKLKDTESALDKLLENASWLHNKLGPVLFQLPPSWKYDEQRFGDFVNKLPDDVRFTFEFRNPTWYNDKVYKTLEEKNSAFCIYELEGHKSPEMVTADFVYMRLHGPEGKYSGSYSDRQLHAYADKINNWKQDRKDVFVYFDNDQFAYAAFNAMKLKEILGMPELIRS